MSYFNVRSRIVESLKSDPEFENIPFYHPSNLNDGLKVSQSGVSIWVVFNGESSFDQTNRADATRTNHNWLVVLVVRQSGSSGFDVSSQDELAGSLMDKIGKYLSGRVLEGEQHPLKRTTPPRPIYQPSVALYPLSFDVYHNS